MTTVLRVPLVVLSYLVEQLRRLPIADRLLRHTSFVAVGLMAAALMAFAVWGATVAPQRVGLADLVLGNMSPMQSWIIVSGDLSGGEFRNSQYRYVLTDPAVPNARMNVLSEVELPVGRTTISGTYVGPREPAPVGYTWIGTMNADPVLAPEQPPPWIALGLAAIGLLVGIAGRFSYPTFFAEPPRSAVPSTTTLSVSVRDTTATPAARAFPGSLRLEIGKPVTVRVEGAGEQLLRLHSAYTSAEVGELRRLNGSEPALRVHQPKGDIDISFASRDERDAAFAALAADTELRSAAARAERSDSTRVEEGTSDS